MVGAGSAGGGRRSGACVVGVTYEPFVHLMRALRTGSATLSCPFVCETSFKSRENEPFAQ